MIHPDSLNIRWQYAGRLWRIHCRLCDRYATKGDAEKAWIEHAKAKHEGVK